MAAIGTHDLDKIKGNVIYKTINIDRINFQPLRTKEEKEINLVKHFEEDKKISKFFNLLTDKNKSVAFCDETGVISIPPIINSERTKISVSTKNVFVEVTGTDFSKVNTALNLILCNFPGNVIEKIQIDNIHTPVLNNSVYNLSINEINKKLCLDLDRHTVSNILRKMMYKINQTEDIGFVSISVPENRSDVMHECDII